MLKARLTPRFRAAVIVALPGLMGISLGCGDPPSIPSPVDDFKVTAVSPTSGPDDSITELTITGFGFEAGAMVTVGGAASDVRVISSRTIKAVAPIHPAGAVDVIVTNPGGRTSRLANAYTYVGFTLNAVSPARGLPGDVLRIHGSGFSTSIALTIGGVEARVIQPMGTELMTFAPALPPGVVEVSVTNPGGHRRTLPQGFTFDAVAISASPNPVKTASNLSVTWSAPAPRPGADWVALYQLGAPNDDSYVWWQYTAGLTQATVTILAPGLPGNFEFRYFADDGYVDAARSAVVTVIAADASQGDAPSWSASRRSPAFPLKRPGRGRGR